MMPRSAAESACSPLPTWEFPGSPVPRALETQGIPMAEAEIKMIPQNYVALSDENDIKFLNRTLDLLDDDDDVQAVYHNWDE